MSTANHCFSGNAKPPTDKSTFATTCNRLSLFLKERGNLRGLGINPNFDVLGKPERSSTTTTTVDLLSNFESTVQTKTEKSTNPLPQYVRLDSFCKTSSSEAVAVTESKASQMTIFYGGQVLVFDCISGEKARDLMSVATGASSSDNQIQNRVQSASTSDSPRETSGSQQQIQILPELQANGSDLPIARRASLHKFLSKRKDRATVRPAPYQLHNPFTAAANHKFDLNL